MCGTWRCHHQVNKQLKQQSHTLCTLLPLTFHCGTHSPSLLRLLLLRLGPVAARGCAAALVVHPAVLHRPPAIVRCGV